MAEYDARSHRMPRNISYDACLNGRYVRLTHLYTKIYEWVCASFRACGLPPFSVSLIMFSRTIIR